MTSVSCTLVPLYVCETSNTVYVPLFDNKFPTGEFFAPEDGRNGTAVFVGEAAHAIAESIEPMAMTRREEAQPINLNTMCFFALYRVMDDAVSQVCQKVSYRVNGRLRFIPLSAGEIIATRNPNTMSVFLQLISVLGIIDTAAVKIKISAERHQAKKRAEYRRPSSSSSHVSSLSSVSEEE
jgi:hypothetical protein